MRILVLSSLFSPLATGGSEITAWQHARWLIDHGHSTFVWASASSPAEEVDGEMVDGIRLWRTWSPRPNPLAEVGRHNQSKRALWHLQDHFDPRNVKTASRIFDLAQPDMIVVHLLVGLGWNVLKEIARRDIPVLYALHDLNLACVRSAMFRNGRACRRQCAECLLSSRWKTHLISHLPRIGFYSPSSANLTEVERYIAIDERIRRICVNPIRYPVVPETARPTGGPLKLLFVGRLDQTKGIQVLLTALARFGPTPTAVTLDVAGSGAELADLRKRYGTCEWLTLHGSVSQARVADLMAKSHLLCVPSIWRENAPGVIIQALGAGLPVLASDIGGIPELIGSDGAGVLLPAGDAAAWAGAIDRIGRERHTLAPMSQIARNRARRFEPDRAGSALYQLMLEISDSVSASVNRTTRGK